MKYTSSNYVSFLKSLIVVAPLSIALVSCDGGGSESSSTTTTTTTVDSNITGLLNEAPSSTEDLTLLLKAESATDEDDRVNLQLFLNGSSFTVGDNNQGITYDYDYTKLNDERARFAVSVDDFTVTLLIDFGDDSFELTYGDEEVLGTFDLYGESLTIVTRTAENDVFYGQNPGIKLPLDFDQKIVTFSTGSDVDDVSYTATTFSANRGTGTYSYEITEYDQTTVQYSYDLPRISSGTMTLNYTDEDRGSYTILGSTNGIAFREDGTFSFR
jgi:hypothetical protein